MLKKDCNCTIYFLFACDKNLCLCYTGFFSDSVRVAGGQNKHVPDKNEMFADKVVHVTFKVSFW